MPLDPAIIGLTMQAVSQAASAFAQYVPKLTDVRKAEANDSSMIGDVRIGEIAAVTLTVGVGVIASGLTGSPVPSIIAALMCLVMLVLYESALRGDRPFEPRPIVLENGNA
jgi:hypothetical protein